MPPIKYTLEDDLFQDTKMFAHGALHHVHGKVHAPLGDEDGCGSNLKWRNVQKPAPNRKQQIKIQVVWKQHLLGFCFRHWTHPALPLVLLVVVLEVDDDTCHLWLRQTIFRYVYGSFIKLWYEKIDGFPPSMSFGNRYSGYHQKDLRDAPTSESAFQLSILLLKSITLQTPL